MGEGSPDPRPTFCVTLDGTDPVGWVDFDRDERAWLTHEEVNIGYALHPQVRGRGLATRSVHLLLSHLAHETDVRVATLAIDGDNLASLAVARRAGFTHRCDLDDGPLFDRPVPPTTYRDGDVAIRPLAVDDAPAHLEGTDGEALRWLWLPEQREAWAALSPAARAEHQRQWLAGVVARRGRGPKHAFAIEVAGAYAGYVDCDLANQHVPHGEANVSYSIHPDRRGAGHASRAVRLALRFLADHTGAREAHVVVDAANEPSLRVARAVGAAERGRWRTAEGRVMVRHVVPVRR